MATTQKYIENTVLNYNPLCVLVDWFIFWGGKKKYLIPS